MREMGGHRSRELCALSALGRLQGHRRLWGLAAFLLQGTEWGTRCPPQVSPASFPGPRTEQAAGLSGQAPPPGHKDVSWGVLVRTGCSIYYISSIGLLVSRGALVSSVLVLTLLPALLLLCDRRIIRKTKTY